MSGWLGVALKPVQQVLKPHVIKARSFVARTVNRCSQRLFYLPRSQGAVISETVYERVHDEKQLSPEA